jgi:hypothetical protein
LYDFGAQVVYLNQQGRWNFGVSISHIPFQYVNYNVVPTTYSYQGKTIPVDQERYDVIRIFQDQASIFTSYPFSKSSRIEFGTGISHYYYRVDRYSTYYDTTSHQAIATSKDHISRQDYESDPNNNSISIKPFTLFNVNTALVGDNSFFGIASPLNGYRYRLQAEYDFGTARYFAPSIDVRKYVRLAPITLAARFYGYGRIGDTHDLLYPLFVGYPFLIRGYEYNSFYNSSKVGTNGFTVNQLSGNRIAVGNFEVRLPFTGPEKLSQIKSKFLFTELNLFFDAGLAWNAGNQIKFQKTPDIIGYAPLTDASGNVIMALMVNP